MSWCVIATRTMVALIQQFSPRPVGRLEDFSSCTVAGFCLSFLFLKSFGGHLHTGREGPGDSRVKTWPTEARLVRARARPAPYLCGRRNDWTVPHSLFDCRQCYGLFVVCPCPKNSVSSLLCGRRAVPVLMSRLCHHTVVTNVLP